MSYTKLSKYMSLILRHKPQVIGITLDEHGWADVNELIAGIAKHNMFNREILEEIVRRFAADKILISRYGVREGYLCQKVLQKKDIPTHKTEN